MGFTVDSGDVLYPVGYILGVVLDGAGLTGLMLCYPFGENLLTRAKLYAKKHKLGNEAVGHAHEIEISAEIKLGEILKDMEKNTGTRGQLTGDVPAGTKLVGGQQLVPPTNYAETLAQIGAAPRSGPC